MFFIIIYDSRYIVKVSKVVKKIFLLTIKYKDIWKLIFSKKQLYIYKHLHLPFIYRA